MYFIVQNIIVALLNKSTYQLDSFIVHTSSLASYRHRVFFLRCICD